MKDITGHKYNFLTALSYVEKRGTSRYWLFQCDCGMQKVLRASAVMSGSTKSCGCFRRVASQLRHQSQRTHGMGHSPEYNSWYAMKRRCLDGGHIAFCRYADVEIHPEWIESFEAFFDHLGPRPPDTSLDRIDNAKGYVPGNVRWATREEQQNNMRTNRYVEFRGRRMTFADFARDVGVPYRKAYKQLAAGWALEHIARKYKTAPRVVK